MNAAETPGRTAKHVLVVDDDAAVVSVTGRALAAKGYAVTVKRTADDALAFLQSGTQSVDFVLCDVIMPGLPGDEFIAMVQERWPHAGTALMTAYATELPNLHCPVLTKPFTVDQLMAVLEAGR